MTHCKMALIVLALLLVSSAASTQENGSGAASDDLEAKIASDPVLTRGAFVYNTCKVCHTIGPDERIVSGPDLTGIFDRVAASDPNYGQYSLALKDFGIKWNAKALDDWLANPYGFLPGNRMSFIGVQHPDDRAALIRYLKLFTSLPREAS